jgi:hypothetical protein
VRSVARGDDTVYMKVYPVRDACNGAVNKLTLRSE